MTLLVGWGLVWLANILAYLGGWMAIFAIAYLTASLLAAVVILPLDALRHLSANEYRDVAAMGKGQLRGGGHEQPGRLGGFHAGLGDHPALADSRLLAAHPLLLMGWLNRRTFAYDALSMHATG